MKKIKGNKKKKIKYGRKSYNCTRIEQPFGHNRSRVISEVQKQSHFSKIISNTNSFFVSQIVEQEVHDTIKHLPNKKFEDDMGLSNYLIKKNNPIITAQLTIVFNQIISEAVYRSCNKTAKVITIFKERDKSLPFNYFPISLLSYFFTCNNCFLN